MSGELSEVNKEKLIADFKMVVADTEELLRATAGQAGEKVNEISARAQDRLNIAKLQAGCTLHRDCGIVRFAWRVWCDCYRR